MSINKYEARIAELEAQLASALDERDEARKREADMSERILQARDAGRADAKRYLEGTIDAANQRAEDALHDMERAEGRRDVWKERAQRYWRIVEMTREARNIAQDDACEAQNRATYLRGELNRAERDTEARGDKRIATWRANVDAEDARDERGAS